jgi:Cyclophilin-like family
MNKAKRLLMSAFVLVLSVMPGPSGARTASGATPQKASFERSQYMKININIGGKILAASLADNATARDFVSVLPLTLSMKDCSGARSTVICRSSFRKMVPGRIGTRSAISPIGLRITSSLSTTSKLESRSLRRALFLSRRWTVARRHSTYRARSR